MAIKVLKVSEVVVTERRGREKITLVTSFL
jgi:hypothetical protein